MPDRTFAIIKPGAMRRRKFGEIIDFLNDHGFVVFRAYREEKLPRDKLEKHYEHLRKLGPRFDVILDNMQAGPVMLLILCDADKTPTIPEATSMPPIWPRLRALLGATDPRQAAPGTIRQLFGIDLDDNVMHASESAEEAEAEIALWLPEIMQ